MLIGELSRQTGVSRDALRMYEQRRLITSVRQENGYRVFPEHSVRTVNLIKEAQSLGFSLQEIAEVIPEIFSSGMSAEELTLHLQNKINDVEQRIDRFKFLLGQLQDRLNSSCPIRQAVSARRTAKESNAHSSRQ